MSLLEVRNLSVRYQDLMALRDLDLEIGAGEMVFVVGPNGAGKSTLLKALANVVPAASGRILLDGRATAGLPPEGVARLGLSMVPEGRDIFATLTVAENLRIGSHFRRDRAAIEADLALVLDGFPALRERLRTPGGLLSGGQQQMLAIGRALMTGARFLALDEPSLGLAPKVVEQVYERLLRLQAERRLTLLVVEQSFARAVRLGSRVVVLRNGRAAIAGDARLLAADGSLERAYFGFDRTPGAGAAA